MFGIFYKGWNLFIRGFRKIKEIFCATAGFFGLKIEPSHFTSQNLQDYKEWIQNFLEKIAEISKNTNAQDIFNLEEVQTGILEPKFIVKRQNSKYLFSKNKELLFLETSEIDKLINHYFEKNQKKSWFLTQYFGVSSDKLTPDKMILLFISKYISEEMIDYDSKSEDLDRLGKLLNYIKELLCVNSIKYNFQLRSTLLQIKTQLDSAYGKMKTRTEHNLSRTLISSVSNLVNSVVIKLIQFLDKIFNFKSLDSKVEIDSKLNINKWLCTVSSIQEKSIEITDKQSVEDFATSFQLIQYDCKNMMLGDEQNLSYFCPALCYKKINDHLLKLRELIIQLLPLKQIISYLNTNVSDVLNTKKIFVVYNLKHVLLSVKQFIKKMQDQLAVIRQWDEYYYVYRASDECTEADAGKLIELSEIINSIEHDITTLDASVLLLQQQLDKIAVPLDFMPEANTQKLLTLIDSNSGLVGKDQAVIQGAFKSFFHELRVNDVFDTALYGILDKYFVITAKPIQGAEPIIDSHEITAMRSGIIKSEDTSLEYYYLILIIFIDAVRQLPRSKMDSTRTILNKIKDFIIMNFLINNYRYIALLFDVITEQTLHVERLEEQNLKLKEAIATHLDNFKTSVLDMIESNRDFFDLNTAIESLVTEALGCEKQYQITIAIDDKKLLTTQEFIVRLKVFIHNLLLKIERLNGYLKHLHRSYMVGMADNEQLIIMQQALNKYNILNTTVIQTNEVLLTAIKSITSLTLSYLSLEKCYKSIIASEHASICDIEEDYSAQMDTINILLGKLEECKCILQHNTRSIRTRILGINLGLTECFSYVLSSIKRPVESYLQVFYEQSVLQFNIRHVFAWASGYNTILEYLIVKYLYDLLCDVVSNGDSQKHVDATVENIFVLIKSLMPLSKSYTVAFISLLEKVYSSVYACYPVDKIKEVRFDNIQHMVPGLLITSPNHLDEQYSSHFKKLMCKL